MMNKRSPLLLYKCHVFVTLEVMHDSSVHAIMHAIMHAKGHVSSMCLILSSKLLLSVLVKLGRLIINNCPVVCSPVVK